MLKKERAGSLGDPVRGITTPFVESFDTALPSAPESDLTDTHLRTNRSPSADANGPQAGTDEHLNFYLNKAELDRGVEHSSWLLTPSHERLSQVHSDDYTSNDTPEDRIARAEAGQTTASEALRRIASLSIGSSKDRLRVNKQRCISTFGRHSTDSSLPPKPAGDHAPPESLQPKERAGPDTGSSEVQIAILTAKIRTLAEFCETRGKGDRVNKRNLRLLVHRRQKLLQYLRRKERGGPRWQNLVETLGLTEGTWKGEISLGP